MCVHTLGEDVCMCVLVFVHTCTLYVEGIYMYIKLKSTC